ncbi:dual specificity phosphatase [Stachybotrys elegans]|uniref:protein-tyrosine-phosphatase n=1 Tax=Stachybotrys elegans TaxID=80388 RepID=A0A8K0WXE3_9HYPO|nr:dual specificity phosphatase [Stachybotrys elegans]
MSNRLAKMPSAAARRIYEDQIPSFMSVFDIDAETMADRDTVTLMDPKMVALDAKEAQLSTQQPQLHPPTLPADPSHRHHDSTSTQMSESADSSPTTTLSTTDSSPLSDPSPSSSPDSPVHLIPLNNFPSTTFGSPVTNSSLLSAPPPTTLERPMTSPGPRRPRNMKGLSIQPPAVAGSIAQKLVSEPSSPAFIKPAIPAMKRKPSHLSLKTSTSDLAQKAATTLEVPQSPAMPPILQRRALKHSASSPHMLSAIKSSTFGPAGGMSFPKVLERNESGLSEVLRPMKSSMRSTFNLPIEEEESSPIRTQMANGGELDPYAEKENNEDQKTPGYPDGPIAIYGDNVYLYLEPSAEEASRFDVVINVAREVKNPFTALPTHPSQPDLSPIPDTAVTTASFMTAFEEQPAEDGAETPTTPKASSYKTPEYIHIPWDHNTDIAPDLMRLCETIDSRTKQGKKVLVHCQQGASRSASLIIAYGLYQKPELNVNDAYHAAQKRSRWISPNMKLMYSLQDFQKEVSKKRLPPASAYRPRTGRSPTKHRLTMSVDAIDLPPAEPQTAPLPGEDMANVKEEDIQPQTRPRGLSSPGRPPISPGPASAPPTCSWQELIQPKATELLPPLRVADLPERPRTGTEDLSSISAPANDSWFRPPPSPGPGALNFGFQTIEAPRFKQQELPLRTVFEDRHARPAVAPAPIYPSDDTLLSPRAEVMTNNPLHQAPEPVSMHFFETPPTPDAGLFSPRATMFPRNPLLPFGRPSQFSDPRSPPTKGETPIVRSIDDLL